MKDFPESVLEPLGIVAQRPDDFLVHQYHLDPGLAVQKVVEQAQGIGWSPAEVANRLEPLAGQFVKALRKHERAVFTPVVKEKRTSPD